MTRRGGKRSERTGELEGGKEGRGPLGKPEETSGGNFLNVDFVDKIYGESGGDICSGNTKTEKIKMLEEIPLKLMRGYELEKYLKMKFFQYFAPLNDFY